MCLNFNIYFNKCNYWHSAGEREAKNWLNFCRTVGSLEKYKGLGISNSGIQGSEYRYFSVRLLKTGNTNLAQRMYKLDTKFVCTILLS